MGTFDFELHTHTPLWTGGIDGTCDRLHETGLVGSLRWWYEALVRGLGGYVCDPASDNPEARCSFDSKAFEGATSQGASADQAVLLGLRTVCPVCYLFGCTGWARRFQLRARDVPTTPLHFCITTKMNTTWLKKVFGGKSQSIDSLSVPYGKLRFQVITARNEEEYASSQLSLVLRLAARYGGLGARLQHGFGQVEVQLPHELAATEPTASVSMLSDKLASGMLRSAGPAAEIPFDLQRFVSLTYDVPTAMLGGFGRSCSVGRPDARSDYLPCVLDLRYKGGPDGKWGLRQWLKGQGWKETKDPGHLEELDLLLGPRSQWGRKSQEKQIGESLRTASRIFFGMPYLRDPTTYALRVFAFLPYGLEHRLRTPPDLVKLLNEYVQSILAVGPATAMLGAQLLAGWRGGER